MASPPPPIPPNVYWNADASNFFSFPLAQGMGDAFYREWKGRQHEFPTGPHHPNWCTHYRTPTQHDTCGAGIAYDTLRSIPFAQRPCFLTELAASKPGAAKCDHLRRPTPVEVEMSRTAAGASLHRLFSAIAATAEWRELNQGQSATTSLPCPTCQARLHVVITATGKMLGQCETPDCTRWME